MPPFSQYSELSLLLKLAERKCPHLSRTSWLPALFLPQVVAPGGCASEALEAVLSTRRMPTASLLAFHTLSHSTGPALTPAPEVTVPLYVAHV